MNANDLLTGPLAQAIGWALLHLLWQATIVAGILAAALALLSRQSANTRYAVSCAALALVFAMFVGTVYRAYDPAAAPVVPVFGADSARETVTVPLSKVPVVIAQIAAENWRDRAVSVVASARQTLPSVVAIWLTGVILLSSRLLVSWMRARRLIRRGTHEAGAHWQRTAARLSDALGLKRAVRLLESVAVEVPSVIGALRPVILLPASTLTGLTPQQIEMVLAHELAHIRRHDFLVNLLQAMVETLMFYHPAVWWMSRRVRIERENCCDDMAVAVCGNPIQYARALTRLEELRSASMSIVVAANGGSLLHRIRRIAAGRAESTASSSRWAAAVAVLSILAIAMAVPSLPAFATKDEPAKTAKAAKAAEPAAEVDVTEPAAEEADPVAEEMETPEPDLDVDLHAAYFELDSDSDSYPVITPVPPAMPTPATAPTPLAAPRARTPRPPRVAMPAPHAPRAPHPPQMAWMMDDEDPDDDEKVDRSRKIGTGGKLTVDELIELRALGVTPDYIDEMRKIFPDLTLGDVTGMRAMGVTADYIRKMREVGLEVTSAGKAQALRALDVTPEFVREMRAAGLDLKSTKDAQTLRALGVTSKFVKQLADAGYANLTVREIARLAAAGIDGDFIREMSKYRDKN